MGNVRRGCWLLVVMPVLAATGVMAAQSSGGQVAAAQQPALGDKPEFDVVSVRENRSDDKPLSSFSLDNGNVFSTVGKGDVFIPNGGYFSATAQPLWRYISFAYSLTGTQELALRFNVFEGLSSKVPGVINQERFDIKARVDGNPTKEQVRQMMQALLADRFKLVVHREVRQVPVLALVLDKPGVTGPQLRPHVEDGSCAAGTSPEALPVAARGLPPTCGVLAHLAPSGPGRASFGGRDVPLSLLATSLPTQTGMAVLPHPVVDETGLTGRFDLRMEWLLENHDEGAPQPDVSGPTFVRALREQLGLKLESKKGPVEIIVVDHVEQPSAN